MDEQFYGKLLNSAKYFDSQNGHRVVEVHPDGSFTGIGGRNQPETEKNLKTWLLNQSHQKDEVEAPGKGQLDPILRLVICSPRNPSADIWPLPLSSSTIRLLFSTWHVSPFLLRSICRQIPMATKFAPENAPGLSGLMLRTNLSYSWQYGLAAVHNRASNVTNCFIAGLTEQETELLLKSLQSAVHGKTNQDTAFHLLIPTLLMDLAIDTLVQEAETRRGNLLEIRVKTGFQGFLNHVEGNTSKARGHLELDNLLTFTQNLTALSDACAGIKAVCKMQFRFLEVIRTFGSAERWGKDNLLCQGERCLQQLVLIEQVLHGVESKIEYTQVSTQGQVQTMYSLIEQTESRAHLDYAEASSRIADQSRKIAELTRRDSIDMRIIAAVTLVFLPGTFTATLFSATFFNFQPQSPALVSRWIWLYCTITTLLTVIVLLGWWYFSKKQTQKTQEAFRTHTWLTQIKDAGKGKPPSLEAQRVDSLALRPYLSGSIAGLEMSGEEEIVFNKRIDRDKISPSLTRY